MPKFLCVLNSGYVSSLQVDDWAVETFMYIMPLRYIAAKISLITVKHNYCMCTCICTVLLQHVSI
jgi:hypothetical protein